MQNKMLFHKLFNLKYITPASTAAFTVFLITFIALFTPPYIGMADNGDYFRILYSNGLYFSEPNYDHYYLGYFIKDYGIFQFFNENQTMLFSSQSIFIKLSIFINQLFYSKVAFDIRFQAAIYTILYTVAVYLFVYALTSKMKRRNGFIVSFFTILVFGDTAYTAYFNSFFSESIVFIFLILFTSFVYFIYRNRFNDYTLLILMTISALFLTTSKQQNAPVGIIIAVAGILLIFVFKTKIKRLLTIILLASICFTGIASYVAISDEFQNINKFHAMTRGVLLSSPNPETSLNTFDIDKQYTLLTGDIHYLPFTTIDVNSNLLIDNFYNQYDFVQILLYYITHPDQAIKMLDLGTKNGFTIRPPAMGNYELTAGKEFGAQTKFFSSYSIIKDKLAPKTFGFVIIWSIIVIGIVSPSFYRAFINKDRRGLIRLPFVITLILIGLSAILVSIVGAGDADLSKHQFLFTATFDVVTLIAIAAALDD